MRWGGAERMGGGEIGLQGKERDGMGWNGMGWDGMRLGGMELDGMG